PLCHAHRGVGAGSASRALTAPFPEPRADRGLLSGGPRGPLPAAWCPVRGRSCGQGGRGRGAIQNRALAPGVRHCRSRGPRTQDAVPGPGPPLTPRSPRSPPTLFRSINPSGPTPGAPAMGSELEQAMESLINVFHTHSGKEGDKYKLSKKELKELLQAELAGFLDAQKDAEAVDKILKDLDENGDGEVDFQEYVVLVAALTVACNTFFWENS
uniref:Protein S100-A1 n=2 Tax=Ornithorhynchus anatinus TaxID=9258 RepID=A0A6I8PFZ0_ORNAN